MLRRALPFSIACVVASSAQAAGGHHAVDDAAILEPGQCQLETWFDHVTAGGAHLWHVGPACRVAAIEIGLNLDALRSEGGHRANVGGAQVKWAHPLGDKVAVGVLVAAAWQDHAPHGAGTTVVIPLTWQATEALQVHVDAGRDFVSGAPDAAHGGIAGEWTASPRWSFIAERFRELHVDRWRLGARRSLNANVSVDLSRAQGLGSAPSSWTVGVNWVFDR